MGFFRSLITLRWLRKKSGGRKAQQAQLRYVEGGQRPPSEESVRIHNALRARLKNAYERDEAKFVPPELNPIFSCIQWIEMYKGVIMSRKAKIPVNGSMEPVRIAGAPTTSIVTPGGVTTKMKPQSDGGPGGFRRITGGMRIDMKRPTRREVRLAKRELGKLSGYLQTAAAECGLTVEQAIDLYNIHAEQVHMMGVQEEGAQAQRQKNAA